MKTRETINEAKKKLEEFVPVMDSLSRARNPFELRYFVIGKHDDRIQQYKQAVIEMESKYQAVLEGLDGLKRSQIKRERLLAQKPVDDLERRELELDLAKLDREDRSGRIAITGATKEVFDFMYILETEFADLLDKTEEELLKKEVEYWKARFAKQIQVDILTLGKIGAGNLSSLLSMPREVQQEIMLSAGERTEEFKQLDIETTKKLQIKLAESYPHKTQFIAPPVHIALKRRKDAPEGYPENKIVDIDVAEIMVATLHRPGDRQWLSSRFYIPTGKNIITHWMECPSGELIGEYRNRLVLDALSVGAEYIMFVDDDLIVPEDALLRLYAHNKDIVGGLYPKKTSLIESASMIKDGDSKKPVPADAKGLVPIDWALTAGLTLIKTSVFKKIAYPWFLTTDKHTEDTHFCARAREAGVEVWLDADLRGIHVDKQTGKQYAM